MKIDFSNRQNRFIKLNEVSKEYLQHIYESTQNDEFYPKYHIAPKHGLVNDPNGLCQVNGEHHIFYQWFPLGPVHGLKHWYHVSTKDFVNYIDRGVALYPTEEYEEHGCFSGSAFIEDGDVKMLYTGNKMVDGIGLQSQCVATMDINTGKLNKEGAVVKYNLEDYTHEFRDPIVYKKDGTYNMLIGAQNKEEKACLSLYRGKTINSFERVGDIDFSKEDVGYMMECPNYYEEDDKGIMIFSPQGISSDNKYDYKNVFSVVYSVGKAIDLDKLEFKGSKIAELDKGFDFYAPQTYLDENGRRILIGWLGNSKSEYPTDKNMWAHMLTLPRELKIVENKIHQKVIKELNELKIKTVEINEKIQLESQSFKLELNVEDNFEIKLSNDEGHNITFSSNGEEYILDRTDMTYIYAEKFGTKRYAKKSENKIKNIEIWFDNSSMEIFCDEGETVFTSRIFIKDLKNIEFKNTKGNLSYLKAMNLQK